MMQLENAASVSPTWWDGELFDLDEFEEEFDDEGGPDVDSVGEGEAGAITDDAEAGEPDEAGDVPDEDDMVLGLEDLDIEADDDDSDLGEITESTEFEADTDWDDTPAARDERVAEYDGDADHETVRERLRETGIAEDVQDALEGLGTDEEDVTTPEGELLDMRNVTRLLAGDTTIEDYYRRRVEKPADDLAVGVSVDMSGSMARDELDTKAAVGAFLFAVEQLGGDVVANGWNDELSTAYAYMVTGPHEQFAWRHLDGIEPDGGTPTGYGIWDCGCMLERLHAETKLLFVITDGSPTTRARDDREFDSSMDEAESTVTELRNRNMDVVGFGFGAVSESKLERMFGPEDSHYVDLEALPDALADEFASRYETTAPTIP